MRKFESFKRLMLIQLRIICLVYQVGIFAYFWYNSYAANIKVTFWGRGHCLVIAIFGALLLFFSKMYGGMKIGYLKPFDVFFSQLFATICATVFSYLQASLLSEWFVNMVPMLKMLFLDLIGIGIWTYLSDTLYRRIFPPREMLLIHGERSIDSILEKFATRKDKYKIVKCMNVKVGFEAICQEATQRYDAVVLWDISNNERSKILKYCYSQSIRVYMMPKISDVIIKGSEQLHLFDTPILLTREYNLTIEQRMLKRLIDLSCALILFVITSPFMLLTAIAVKVTDGGPILYKQVRCTIDQKEFSILKFRSMQVDAEKDGVARLAGKNDSRITPIGKFIRAVRLDELPQLINIIKGDMSFIGPRPERPEIIKQYMEQMPEFAFRTKVKAGLAGYAQIYGKYNTTPYDKLKLDLFYIENYTLWLDIKLMLLTLKIIFRPESTEGIDASQTTALKETGEDE